MRPATLPLRTQWTPSASRLAPTTASCASPAPSPTWRRVTRSPRPTSPKPSATGRWIGSCGNGDVMTRAEWLALLQGRSKGHSEFETGLIAEEIVVFLLEKASERRLRLLLCACVRLLRDRQDDE